MSGWPEVPLGSVAKIIRGVTYAKGDVVQTPGKEDVPILRAGNINGRLITDHDLVWLPPNLVSAQQRLQHHDIVVCMSSGSASVVGKSALLEREWRGSFGAFCAAVRADPKKAAPSFLAHVLAGAAFRSWASSAQGNNIKNLNKSALEGYKIFLPPLEEQRRIVGLLDRAAEIRRRADAARTQARAIIPALFTDMFGDPATNPKGWPSQPLGLVVDRIVGGKNLEAGNGSSCHRILKVSAVTSGYFRPEEAKPAPDEHQPIPDHSVRNGDFLFSRANTSALVGAVAIVECECEGLLLPDKIWRIEWREEVVEPRFMYALMRSPHIRGVFARLASGTSDSMKNISQAKLRSIEIPLPPLPLQSAFAEQARRIEATARALDVAAAKSEAMAAALSAEVFDMPAAASPATGRVAEPAPA